MFIVLTGTPAHDSTGLHSSTRPLKMCPFSSTLMKDTLSRVTEGKSHVILNKDMVYPGVVLYIRLSTSTYIHPRREKVSPLLTVLARSVTATVAAFHSIWIRDRASLSTSELMLLTPRVRDELENGSRLQANSMRAHAVFIFYNDR